MVMKAEAGIESQLLLTPLNRETDKFGYVPF